MKPRPYQLDFERAVLAQLRDNGATLGIMPTGCGKTFSFWRVLNQYLAETGGHGMVIAHREELIAQAFKAGERLTDFNLQVEQAEQVASQQFWGGQQVTVASIASLNSGPVCPACRQRSAMLRQGWMERTGGEKKQWPGCEMGCQRCMEGKLRRMMRFSPEKYSLIVIDEAHHAVAGTYRRVLDYFRGGGTKVLGVTATPDRTDEAALGQVFETVAYNYELPDAINDGWLVPLRQACVTVDHLDLSSAKLNKHGDLQDKDVSIAMQRLRAEGHLHEVVDPTIELAGDRPTIIFTADVNTAEAMTEVFDRHRPGRAAYVCGDTRRVTKDQRRSILRGFASGEIQYLCNVGVLTEGVDVPATACVAMARPTASRALYAQCVGRGTRTLPGTIDGVDYSEHRKAKIADSPKPDLLVLDFCGNSGRHKLVNTADILGGKYEDEVVERAKQNVLNASTPVDMTEEIEKAVEETKQLRLAQAQRDKNLIGKAKFRTRDVNPFDLFDVSVVREPGWHQGRQASPKQIQALEKFGIDQGTLAGLSFWKASQLMDKLITRSKGGLCSPKQAKLLSRFGIAPDTTRENASKLIDFIAKRGWRPSQGEVNQLVEQLNAGVPGNN